MTVLKRFVFCSAFLFLLIVTACNQTSSTTEEPVESDDQAIETEAQEYTEVTIENADRTVTFTEQPQRAVTLNQHTTEVMLALGLEEFMVGTAFLDDEILPEFQEAYQQIPVLSDQYPSQEVFLAEEPDFAYAGWSSAFHEDHIGSIEQLEQYGVKSYLHNSSTIIGPTIEDVYDDILLIGKIFNVEQRAVELIKTMKNQMENIQSTIHPNEKPIQVFVYDSGEMAPLTSSQNFLKELIEMAGGENIFADINKNWAEVSWEEVVDRNPELIIIIDYGETTVEQKKEFLLTHSALENVPAIQEERFVVMPLSAAAEGIRAPLALEILVNGFYSK
ncbi:ABC transporter substrate-binding protein [Anaerobacillus sp. MEB173]|uniref:ABC transporter substrate-binding protein n=1 Tax=Anaerobacillus sp. MEB173 TaxID=3383345 RepID=UPI003F8F36B4